MTFVKRLERLEGIIGKSPIIDELEEERRKIHDKALKKLNKDEKDIFKKCLLNFKRNGLTWLGIETDKNEINRMLKIGLSRLDKDEFTTFNLLIEKKMKSIVERIKKLETD